ncbi:MAG: lamin tail domain-containing protein [Verrucomicrobia bacterium]|nr:lamin tail domain-containing protein [Verrucomicrobiota bacterium]
MTKLTFRPAWPALLSAGIILLQAFCSRAQPFLPADVGTTVSGFQDDFDGASLGGNWAVRGANVFTVSGGMLHVANASGDPNHLLCESPGYNNTVQEVLARLRVTNFGTGDPARAGVSAGVDPSTSQGLNWHFRDEPSPGQRHLELLDDSRAWGPELAFAWANNVWYWVRLRHEPNAPSQGGANDVFAKIWLADGSVPEPAVWQLAWDYTPARTTRAGFAGITAGSLNGVAEFDVDYVLIKASGLPNVVVAPRAFVQTPVAITNQPQSLTVAELFPASFSVGANGNPQPTYQWWRNGAPIPGATNATCIIAMAALDDDGALFKVVAANTISNLSYSVTSSVATLGVIADTNPPVLVRARSLGLAQVQASFSERIAPATGTNRALYSVIDASGNVAISSAALDATQTNVLLEVSPLEENAVYTLTVNGLTDQAAAANLIASNSQATFIALSYASQDIGNPALGGSIVAVPNGMNVTGGGTNIGGNSDQFQFNSVSRTGDFDVKVRVESLALSDAWAEAGLMARETLDAGSRFASVMATPTISGCFFRSRSNSAAPATVSGSCPVNPPQTWLRLKRAGSQFTGYAGFDGQSWAMLGTANLALPSTVLFGFAVSSHQAGETTTAAFRDLSDVSSVVTNATRLDIEPLGQCSRLTSLVISEIMYHPPNILIGTNAARLEYIELFNARGETEDLSGYRLSGDVDYTFPSGTVLPGGGFLVVARAPEDLQSVYGFADALGPWDGASTNGLPNDAGTIRLRHRTGAVFLEVNYSSEPPWPAAADGAGHSLVLARPSFGERDPRAWAASDAVLGSPGRLDAVTPDPLRAVVINEFLAHADGAAPNFIELYNRGTQPLDLSGCFLTDDPDTNKFALPPNTLIPARGFVSFDETQLGFGLKAGGETIYFRNAAGTRVLDAVRFEAQASGVSMGRFPDGASAFRELASRTPGTNNAPPLARDVVINEIMFAPISGRDADQFVELYNRGPSTVALGDWRFVDGINFTFPSNTLLAPGGYLVVAKDAARLLTNYPNLPVSAVLGDFGGTLSGRGERLALAMPQPGVSTNAQHQAVTNTIFIVVNEVTYGTGGRWPRWADGGGSSLELTDPRSDNRLAANWADSDETAKAPWTVVSRRGVVDNGNVAADQLQVLLQGAGECLIDGVEVLNGSGVNLIANSTFESGATSWTAEGTESPSGLETTEGYFSARSYHVRAVDRGDNQVNRIRTPLTSALASGDTATIRAKVRWLRGHPEILFRLRGNWLEAVGTMTLPANLGTPGTRNSRAVPNAPPAIYDVAHSPVLPAANQAVVVTARVDDSDGVAALSVVYRLDPATNSFSVPMRDDGTGGDAVAGDGLFSATLPGQTNGALVAFYVQAGDGFTPSATSRFPNDAPARECLVRFGENVPTGNFPVYRLWMTQATFNTWDARHNLDNTPNDVTFVLGSQRAMYNTLALYAGSPYIAPGFTTPSGNRCGYSIMFPPDDKFLGNEDLVLDWPGGHGGENTAVQEQMAYWIADQMNLPFSHRHFIRLQVNGVTDMQRGGVFEAVIQPAGDFLDAWSFGDTGGEFYKIDRAFEYPDTGTALLADPMPQLLVYTTPNLTDGGTMKKTERYRWTWLKRSFDTANNYTNVFALADALNATSPEPYTSATEGLADVERWMGIFAFEHIINNFDSWGHDIGKNMYAYKPRAGRWQLYAFDLDWLMLVSPRGPGAYTASTGPLFSSNDPTVTRLYNHPPFRRAYFRAVQDAVDGPLLSANCDPIMDAKYASLVANGVTMCDGGALVNPSFVKAWFRDRRTYLLAQLANVNAGFGLTGPSSFTANSNLVSLSGTAPITVKTITVNDTAWLVTWTSVSNWTLRLAPAPGTNQFTVLGYDARGQLVAGASNAVTVVYPGEAPSPQGSVVINEIMFNPVQPDAEFVELFNTSSTAAFDLSGWRFNGLDYVFPGGSVLGPRGFLVLAKDRVAFDIAYGPAIVVFDEFAGNLQAGGETLTLLQPGLPPALDTVIDKVRYDSVPPWPVGSNNVITASTIQLLDAVQDNSRPCNWATRYAAPTYEPGFWTPAATNSGWRFVAVTGNSASTASQRLLMSLDGPGSVVIDEISIVAGTNAAVGANFVRNGDFETAPLIDDPTLTNSWTIVAWYTNTTLSTGLVHNGTGALRLATTNATSGLVARLVSQWLSPPPPANSPVTLSFWYCVTNNYADNGLYLGTNRAYYLANTTCTNLTLRIASSSLRVDTNITAVVTPAFYTPPRLVSPLFVSSSPGASNSLATSLPAIPPLWLNEVQPLNLDGLTNRAGQREPWIELYNAGTNAIALEGLSLATNFTNLTEWAFPAGAVIEAGEFRLIFADGRSEQSTPTELHTSFRLAAAHGSIALARLREGQPEVLDYLNYAVVPTNHSYGSFPDAQPFERLDFFHVTPGAPNNGAPASLTVFINEWMAANTRTLADPADGQFDDWIELFNPGTEAISLAGYFLTDTLTNKTKWPLPSYAGIGPRGYLLVWADENGSQNSSNRLDLHANFKLAAGGEEIGLFAPDGTPIDAVTFGPQTNDVSQGRYPDGAGAVHFMATPTPRAANIVSVVPVPPRVGEITMLAGGAISFSFSATLGQTYRVEYKNDLNEPLWTPLDGEHQAPASTVTVTNALSGVPQRFYRVVLWP